MPEGTADLLREKHVIKDYLSDIHKLKDLRDINNRTRERLTFSLRREADQAERAQREEYQFHTMSPMEDFLRPEATDTSRQTGYEHGHVRSLLKLDVFGPAASVAAEAERAIGLVPPSPNRDRFKTTEPHRCGSPNTVNSRSSTASSYAFPKVLQQGRHSLSKRTLRFTQTTTNGNKLDIADLARSSANSGSGDLVDMHAMHGMFHQSSNPIVAPSSSRRDLSSPSPSAADEKLMLNFRKTFSNPTTALLLPPASNTNRMSAGDLGYHGPAISAADRLPMDPLLKRTLYAKTYKKNQEVRSMQHFFMTVKMLMVFYIARQDKKEMMKDLHREVKRQQAQQRLAEQERKAVRDFERHLVLAKIQA